MKLALRITAALALVVVAVAILINGDSPQAPSRGTIITASTNISGSVASSTEAFYIEQIQRRPDRVDGYADLAQFYLLRARETANEATYVPLAAKQLEKALDLDADDYRARILMGTLQNKLHQFERAELIARSLIAQHPGHAYNYGTLVDALVELGRYDEAIEAMDAQLARRPDLTSYSRVSYLRELMGDTDGAIKAMEMAAEAGIPGTEGRSWALHQLSAMALGQGQADQAERILLGLLDESPNYPHALAGLAHVRMVEGRIAQARDLVEQAMNAAPNAGFEELAAEIYLLAGEYVAYEAAVQGVEDGLDRAQAIGENVRMERADYYADLGVNLDEALALAGAEIDRRPDHLHANETYAWALRANGRAKEAIAFIDHARRFDNGDAMLTYRAGRIYLDAGLAGEGRALLRQSLEEGLHIESPSAAAEAGQLIASAPTNRTSSRVTNTLAGR